MNRTVIINGKLIFPNEIWENGYIILENGLISDITREEPEINSSDNVIDAKGNYVAPGFIDIHTHGAGNSDFMDATVDAYLNIAETHARYGTTALLPTTLTSTDEELFYTFDIYKKAKEENKKGAQFLGMHLEGPYFAYSQRGAQDPKYLKNPIPEDYMKILGRTDDIVRWSIAPELDGAIELGKVLKSKDIIASVAHTDAVFEEVVEAFESGGYTLMTHFYSAMSSVTRRNAYRYAGAVEAGYYLDGMDVEIIADGIHLPQSLLKLIYKLKGSDRIALVTDSMRGAGMPDGHYKLGSLEKGQEVLVEDGVAKLLDRSAFAGSVATADRLVRTMVQIAEVPLVEAVKMITLVPARILKVNHKKGSLAKGMDADIVIFDDQINIQATIIGGKPIYKI